MTMAEFLGVGSKAQSMSFEDLKKTIINLSQSKKDILNKAIPGISTTLTAVDTSQKIVETAKTAYQGANTAYNTALYVVPGVGPAAAAKDAAKLVVDQSQVQLVNAKNTAKDLILNAEVPIPG